MTNNETLREKLHDTILREQFMLAYTIKKREIMLKVMEKEIVEARQAIIANPNLKEDIEKQIAMHKQLMEQTRMEIENKKDSIFELHGMMSPKFFEEILELITPPEKAN